jgi:hypothetical protein
MDLIELHGWTPLPAHDPHVPEVIAGAWSPWHDMAPPSPESRD